MNKKASDVQHLEVSGHVFDKFQHLKDVISQLTGNNYISDEQLLMSMIEGFFDSIDGATHGHAHGHDHDHEGGCCGGHDHHHGHGKDGKKDKECCGNGSCGNC